MRTFRLLLPLLFCVSLAVPPAMGQAPSDSTYTVQSGDTLYGIAERAGVSVRTLMRWNDLENTTLNVGQTLRIRPPASAARPPGADDENPTDPSPEHDPPTDGEPPTDTSSAASNESVPYARYRSRAGDTFVMLALRLGTPADSLFRLNDSTKTALAAGQELRLPRRFGPPTHVVKAGETLYSIAGEYGVSVRALKAKNDLASDTLRPGQKLRVPGRSSAAVADESWAAPDTSGRVAEYPSAFSGRLTASGAQYDPDEYVVSHPSLPFNSIVLLSTPETNEATFARVIDRGPVDEDVLMDVSTAVAKQLGIEESESSTVDVRLVWSPTGSP